MQVLNGMPGIFSARWAGRHGDDPANLALVLAQIADIAEPSRVAHFTCAAALALPDGREGVAEGRLDGSLTLPRAAPTASATTRSSCPDGGVLTTAELTPEAKDAISHRGRAFRALVPVVTAELGLAPA